VQPVDEKVEEYIAKKAEEVYDAGCCDPNGPLVECDGCEGETP